MANSFKLNSRTHESTKSKIKRRNVLNKAVNSDKSGLKPDPSLNSFGRSIFKAIVDNNRHLNSSDNQTVNILCHEYQLYLKATHELEKRGLVEHGKKSPYYSILKQTVDTIFKISSQLNLTPKNRINADFKEHAPKEDPVKAALE